MFISSYQISHSYF